MAQTLRIGDIWTATLAVLRGQFWTLFWVAAPFTLLIDMALAVFGPAPPKALTGFTPQIALQLVLLPSLIGAIGQLTVARLVTNPGDPPRAALAAAFGAFPLYALAVLLSAIPVGFGLVALIVPGLYLAARLFLSLPVAAAERLGPLAMLERSWRLTQGHGFVILAFLVLGILFTLGVSLIGGGIGAALGSILALAGEKAAGAFVDQLVTASLATALSVASAAAAGVIYLRLK